MSEPIAPTLPDRVLRFEPCEACSYDLLTDTGERSCHYYECPYLPEELSVWCPTCFFDFATDDGNPACGATPRCDFAVRVAPERLANVRAWEAARAR